jgi:uncharacterized protein (DUF885 family)
MPTTDSDGRPKVDGMHRNGWTACAGIGGRHGSESVVDMGRKMQLCPGAATQLGDHRWDDRLAEYSPAALESQYQEILAALAEVRRYTQSPTQPQSYLMGKLQIVELVSDYCRAHPAASLHEVHDAILGCGSLPPRLMRQRLLGG